MLRTMRIEAGNDGTDSGRARESTTARALRAASRRTILTCAVVAALGSAMVAAPQDLETGDVVAGVSNGQYDVYDNAGNFILTLTDGMGGFTTGAFYDTTTNLLYTTNFSSSTVVVYDGLDPHAIVDTIPTGPFGGGACESIVFDNAGNFYVGHAGGDADIKMFSSAGAFLDTFDVAVENVGSDWIDLAADQSTIFYTSEGRRIMRYDVVADVQLADFALLPGGLQAFALRLLPPFDGTGGLIVADRDDIVRVNSAGVVAQTYDVAGENDWFAMNLDPNGTSFWAGSFGLDNFYRFNIATGAVEVGPISAGTGNTLFGLAVVGEITGGQNNPPIFEPPSPCDTSIAASVGAPVSYSVVASDIDGDVVTLSAAGTPIGASHVPPLPAAGNPVSTTFSWTPTNADVGTHVIVYTATDGEESTECEVSITVEGQPCFTLDFDTDDEGAPMAHGTKVDSEFDGGASFPVTITSSSNTAAILNSSTGPAAQDPDLLVGSGNILILQNASNLSECPPASGVYCSHNDDEDGGTLSFAFDASIAPVSIDLVDIDTTDPETTVVLTDENGNTRTYTIPANWTGDISVDGPPGMGTLDLTTEDPQPGFGSIATESHDVGYDPANVVLIEVNLGGSGGVDNLGWCTDVPLAAAEIRNGSGQNPMNLTAVSMPVIGETWAADLDCRAYGSGLALLVVRRLPVSGTSSAFGEVLVGGSLLHRMARQHAGSVSTLTWAIPYDLSLCGLEVHAQGLCRSSSGAVGPKTLLIQGGLSNAIDLTLGF